MHRLSELQGDNPMVLMLGRGEHCPRERQHQREMVKLHDWCPVAFTEMVTILPNDLHDTNKMKIATGAYWTFLADERARGAAARSTSASTPTPTTTPTVPHTLVLAPGLAIDKVYVGYWFWGRPSRTSSGQDLADLFQRIKPDFDPLTDEARAAWESSQAEPVGAH